MGLIGAPWITSSSRFSRPFWLSCDESGANRQRSVQVDSWLAQATEAAIDTEHVAGSNRSKADVNGLQKQTFSDCYQRR
jgi:hypothetical protein